MIFRSDGTDTPVSATPEDETPEAVEDVEDLDGCDVVLEDTSTEDAELQVLDPLP